MVASATHALNRLLAPLADCFTVELAERLVSFSIDPETRARIDELAQKANQGQLSDAENAEYREYVEGIDLIAVLQSQAKDVLVRRAAR
jgi:hypothetical protein